MLRTLTTSEHTLGHVKAVYVAIEPGLLLIIIILIVIGLLSRAFCIIKREKVIGV